MELPELIGSMATIAESLRGSVDVVRAQKLITAAVVDTIPGVTYAGISVANKTGIITSHAPTDPVVATADELQCELGEGPCIDATMAEEVVLVDDLRTDPRWPLYGPKAGALGLCAQLSFQIRAEPAVRGSLNLYAAQPDAFDADAHAIGAMFADWTAVLLGWSREQADLLQALESRSSVGTAIGILMERYQLDQQSAFAFLARLSQNGNVKLRGIAADIVAETARQAG